ncbi:MAG: DsrE/DsrF/DrsH-like family protein [Anaerolineae bacterium]
MDQPKKRIAIIAAHGTLDAAYPPLILSTTAVAMDMEAAVFFTFYGLEIIKRNRPRPLQVAPLANPAMPMPVPNIVGVLPGMTTVATNMMNSWMTKAQVAKIDELLEIARESGVRLIGCQMTMDVMGVKADDLLPYVELGGAATFLEFASQNAITLAF